MDEPNNTIYALFKEQVSADPAKPAVIENDRVLSFGDLDQMTDRIAAGFPDKVQSVGIILHHRAEMIASILAVLRSGARYIPAEPDFPTGRIRDMMTEAQVDFILTEPDLLGKSEGFPVRMTDEILRDGAKPAAPPAAQDPEKPAYVLYTSGTTGRPKGVCVRNRNVCHYVRAFAEEFRPGPGDIMLQNSVCTFDIFVEEVFGSLLNGAALAIPAAEDWESVPASMAFAERHGVTMLSGFPYLLAQMNQLPEIPGTLRLLISGGDVLRGVYVTNLLDKAAVYNTYGPSETTVCATYYHCNTGKVLEDGTYPIGKPIRGVEIRILDPEGDKEVPAGETGEICILGDGVSMGYIGDHKEEQKAFVTLPDGTVMYRSGDLGYWLPDGNIAFLHRMDDQIMIYGKRVEIAEVTSRLMQCTNVRQAVVRALNDQYDLPYMVAYVVPEKPGLDIKKIREELAVNLPPYMIPEFFVEMQEIPLTLNGKPDTEKLPVVKKGEDHG
ncbi:MAG: amino acid adenylation domain-containing protein [Oscillospiraceae bacterium]|nr:amino acid adenylation domain-containing protein [Oscillospiraceae bacterium]